MNGEFLIVFLILLLAFILFTFLGRKNLFEGMTTSDSTTNNANTNEEPSDNTDSVNTNVNSNYNQYDNYDHYNQSSYPVIFYGPNGATARVIQTPNDNTIVITYTNGTTDIYYINGNVSNANVQQYYGSNGASAKIVDVNGSKAVQITTSSGETMYFYSSNTYSNSVDNTINQYSTEANTGSSGSDYTSAFTNNNLSNSQVNTLTGPAGNSVSTYDSSAYMNSLPKGVPKRMIPPGEEDLYILKSEVVPPVCPKCPDPIVQCPNGVDITKCPPCPAPARCPEPSFECAKVPNYKAFNPDTMPIPVLNDFSQFGM